MTGSQVVGSLRLQMMYQREIEATQQRSQCIQFALHARSRKVRTDPMNVLREAPKRARLGFKDSVDKARGIGERTF